MGMRMGIGGIGKETLLYSSSNNIMGIMGRI